MKNASKSSAIPDLNKRIIEISDDELLKDENMRMRDFKLQQKYQELGLKPKEIKYRQYQRKYYEIMKQRRLTRKINRKVRKSGDKKAPKRNSESRLNSLSSSSGSSDDSSNDESLEPIRKKRLIVSLEFDSPKVEEKK